MSEPLRFPAPPWRFCCIDLETDDGRPDEIERELALTFRGWVENKDETIGKKYREAIERKKAKLGLINAAPIRVVTMRSDLAFACIHDLQRESRLVTSGGQQASCLGVGSEREILSALRELLNLHVGEESVLVGHNLLGFDLPKLRHRFIRNGLALPACLAWKPQPVFDTMKHFVHHVSNRGEIMISLGDVLDDLGIPNHKATIDGGMVGTLIREGRFDELIDYALKDVLAEAELYLRLTGQVADAPAAAGA